MVETIGAGIIAVSILIFMANVAISLRRGERAGPDPWDARTVEWLTASPPPMHNFDEIPQITARDEAWHRKYAGHGEDAPVPVPAGASQDHPAAPPPDLPEGAPVPADAGLHTRTEAHSTAIHMPDPSYYPMVAAAGLPIASYGVFLAGAPQVATITLGLAITFIGLFGWAFEPSAEEHH